jgi:hypothetical protein
VWQDGALCCACRRHIFFCVYAEHQHREGLYMRCTNTPWRDGTGACHCDRPAQPLLDSPSD